MHDALHLFYPSMQARHQDLAVAGAGRATIPNQVTTHQQKVWPQVDRVCGFRKGSWLHMKGSHDIIQGMMI